MVNAPNDFPDKVNVGVRLEEDVGKGCSYEDGSSANGVKRFDNDFSKKRTRGRNDHHQNHHVHQQNQQVPNRRKTQFDSIPITYTELFPILLQRNLVQTRRSLRRYIGTTKLIWLVLFIKVLLGMTWRVALL